MSTNKAVGLLVKAVLLMVVIQLGPPVLGASQRKYNDEFFGTKMVELDGTKPIDVDGVPAKSAPLTVSPNITSTSVLTDFDVNIFHITILQAFRTFLHSFKLWADKTAARLDSLYESKNFLDAIDKTLEMSYLETPAVTSIANAREFLILSAHSIADLGHDVSAFLSSINYYFAQTEFLNNETMSTIFHPGLNLKEEILDVLTDVRNCSRFLEIALKIKAEVFTFEFYSEHQFPEDQDKLHFLKEASVISSSEFDEFSQYRDSECSKNFHVDAKLEEIMKPVSHSCDDSQNTLKVTGSIVKLSDFVDEEDYVIRCNGEPVQKVHVFAYNIMHFDRSGDFNLPAIKGTNLEVIIIASVWVIDGSSTIDLSGADGISFDDAAREGYVENENGVRGDNGEPGEPGNAGGPFFGLADKCENLGFDHNILTIQSNGGNGGDGQNGGNCGKAGYYIHDCFGNGGAGGEGGHKGLVDFTVFVSSHEDAAEVNIISENGNSGLDGHSGTNNLANWINGEGSGVNGVNTINSKPSSIAIAISAETKRDTILSFKYEGLIYQAENEHAKEFFGFIDHLPFMYNVDSFAQELQYINTIYQKNQMKSYKPYESLGNRIELYDKEQGKDEEQSLVYALLSEISYTRSIFSQDNVVIVNLEGYFSVIERLIEEKETQASFRRIKDSKKNFEDEQNARLEHIKQLINDTVLPAIEGAKASVDSGLEDLPKIYEEYVNERKNILDKDKHKLEKAKKKLKNSLIFGSFMCVINTIIGISSIATLGVGAPVAATAITGTAGGIGGALNSAGSLYNNYQNDKEKVDELKDVVEEDEKILNEAIQGKAKIVDYAVNIAETLKRDLQDMLSQTTQTGEVSQIPLIAAFKKWQIRKIVGKLRHELQLLSKNIDSRELDYAFHSLEEVIVLLMSLLEDIEKGQEVVKTMSYIVDAITFASLNSPSDDSKVSSLIETSKQKAVVLLTRQLISGVGKHVFPFSGIYIGDLRDDFEHATSEKELDMARVKKLVSDMKSSLTLYRSVVTKHDEYIISQAFYSNLTSSRPFYKWQHDHFQHPIYLLLSGHKISLYAYLDSTPQRFGAIKFRTVELNLKIDKKYLNTVSQSELEDELKSFSVKMTHSGTSYFRFQNQTFKHVSSSLQIRYSFEQRNGNSVSENQVYEKIKNGDIFLSPYTLWTFELFPENEVDSDRFAKLKQWASYISLELEGTGTYVDEHRQHTLNINTSGMHQPENTYFSPN